MNTTRSGALQKILNTWAIVLIIWTIYRTKVNMPEWFDEFIAKPAVFILPVYIYISKYENKNFFANLWISPKKILSDIYIGISLGAVFSFSALLANYVRYGNLDFIRNIFSNNIGLAIALTFATAVSEEVLSRGFILKRLYEDSNNIYTSSFLSSILFLILHIPILFTNAHLNGSLLLLFLGTDFILSLVNSFIFLDRKSLFAPILIHMFYNLAILFYI